MARKRKTIAICGKCYKNSVTMNRLILLVESRIRGDVYVRFGGELPKTHRSNTAGRWMLSLPLKSVHNLVKDARKVQQTVLLVGDISEMYVTNYQKMLSDPNFTPGELNAIAFGYTKLLEESSGLLEELKTVVNANGLSMSDKERMDVIDRVYRDVKDYRNLVAYYTNRNISVSYLRAKEKMIPKGFCPCMEVLTKDIGKRSWMLNLKTCTRFCGICTRRCCRSAVI